MRQSDFVNIREWGISKGLIFNGNQKTQYRKLVEEVNELGIEIELYRRNEIKLEIGDCVVVLTILAAQYELPIEECIEAAYDKIRNRTGKTINGTFIKDKPNA